jgi:hypothetical protein
VRQRATPPRQRGSGLPSLPANADAASLGSGREIAMLDAPCRQRQPEDGQRETNGQAKPIPDAEHRLAEVSGQRKLMDPALPRVAEVIARVTGVSYHPGHSPACIGCDAQVASRPVSAKSLFFAREGD